MAVILPFSFSEDSSSLCPAWFSPSASCMASLEGLSSLLAFWVGRSSMLSFRDIQSLSWSPGCPPNRAWFHCGPQETVHLHSRSPSQPPERALITSTAGILPGPLNGAVFALSLWLTFCLAPVWQSVHLPDFSRPAADQPQAVSSEEGLLFLF